MTRFVLPVLSALLAFANNVDAKSKEDQILLYQFTANECAVGPKGTEINVKREACVKLDARSLKPAIDPKRMKWLDEVNSGEVQCALQVYENTNCVGEPKFNILLPESVTKCYDSDPTEPIRSAKLHCAPNMFIEEK